MVDKHTFLKVDQLKIHRMGKLVVDIPSLNVEQGDVLAVAGPNGAGKSTFLLALAGLIKPTSGNIFIGQNSNNASNHADHKKCALVLQEPLLLHTSIRENIGIGLSFRGVDKRHDPSKSRPLAGSILEYPTFLIGRLTSCLAGKLNGSVWLAHLQRVQTFCSWMNHSVPWMLPPGWDY